MDSTIERVGHGLQIDSGGIGSKDLSCDQKPENPSKIGGAEAKSGQALEA